MQSDIYIYKNIFVILSNSWIAQKVQTERMQLYKHLQFLLLLICLVTHHSAAQPFMPAHKVETGLCGTIMPDAIGPYFLSSSTACENALNQLKPAGKPWTINTETAKEWPSGCYLDGSNNAWYNYDRSAPSNKTHKCENTHGCYCETVISATTLPASSMATNQITNVTTKNCEEKHMHSVLRKDACAAAAAQVLNLQVSITEVTQKHEKDAPTGCYIGKQDNKIYLNTDKSDTDPQKNPNKKCNAQNSKGCICVEPHTAPPCNAASTCAPLGKVDNAISTRTCLVTPASDQCTAWAAANPTTPLTCARGCKDEPSSSLTAEQLEAIYAAKYTAMCTSRL